VDAEVQQRCVEYLMLCEKGPGMVDIMAEMPKFPERQVCCCNEKLMKFSWLAISNNSFGRYP